MAKEQKKKSPLKTGKTGKRGDIETRFKPGQPGGPGRPIGGRRKTLDSLDAMLANEKNLIKFEKALQDEFDKDPLKFWKEYAFPLLPRNIELTGFDGGPIETIDLTKLNDKELDQYIKYTKKANS